MSVRVRFAPSPTGALHIGGVRTALYNYLIAKKTNGTFILRIEDTDQGRFVPGAEDYIREALKWCGIEPTEGQGYREVYGPYRQSERKLLYHDFVQKLLNMGAAYYAFDTESELEHMRDKLSNEGVPAPKYDASVRMGMKNSLTFSQAEVKSWLEAGKPYVIRLLVNPGDQVSFVDTIRGEVNFDTSELDDKVLVKADGMPTYHFANVVDDHLMQISHVIRGEEWISSTGHHLLLYKAFGWSHPEFAHLPLIMRPDGKGKLSKRDGAKFGIPVFPLSWMGSSPEESFIGFREFGFEPEATINFLAFLGWNPGTDQELFSLEELVQTFDISRVHLGGARFDMDKAKWFNQQYIRKMSIQTIESKLLPILNANGIGVPDEKLSLIIKLFQERVHLIKEIPEQASYLFSEPNDVDMEALKKQWKPELKDKILDYTASLSSVSDFTSFTLESFAKEKLKDYNLKPGEVFPIFRLALAGSLNGPTVFQMLEVLGLSGLDRIKNRVIQFSTLV